MTEHTRQSKSAHPSEHFFSASAATHVAPGDPSAPQFRINSFQNKLQESLQHHPVSHTLYAVFANPVLPPSSLIPPFLLFDPKMPSASLGIRFCQVWWTLVRLNQSNSRTARTAQPPVMVMCAACTSGAQRTSCATRINCSLIFQTNDSRTMFCVAAMVRPLPNCAVC